MAAKTHCDEHDEKICDIADHGARVKALEKSDSLQWDKISALETSALKIAGAIGFLKWAIPASIAGSAVIIKLF